MYPRMLLPAPPAECELSCVVHQRQLAARAPTTWRELAAEIAEIAEAIPDQPAVLAFGAAGLLDGPTCHIVGVIGGGIGGVWRWAALVSGSIRYKGVGQ